MNNNETIDGIVVIPAPASHYDILLDTIHSIRYYVKEPHKIIVMDDSGTSYIKTRLKQERRDEGIIVLSNERTLGKKGGLYTTLATAYKHAYENYDFRVLLRMDTDALITNYGLITEAIHFFEQNPMVGLIGSYHIKSDGTKRTRWQWALVLLFESNPLRGLLGRERLWRREIREARKNGYRLGENVFGGACILSRKFIASLYENGYLDLKVSTLLEEDIIFSLLAKALGFHFASFGMPDQSMALGMYSLTIPKEEIIRQKKKIIHSLKRGYEGESQEELREYFAKFRKNRSA